MSAHTLYTDADADRPEVICDRNGSVVLGLCKVCNKGEIELSEPCTEGPEARLARWVEYGCQLSTNQAGRDALGADLTTVLRRLGAFDWIAGVYDDRKLTAAEVGDELADLKAIAENVGKVYDYVSGGQISKPTTHAVHLIAACDDRVNELVAEALKESSLFIAAQALVATPIDPMAGNRTFLESDMIELEAQVRAIEAGR